MDIVKFNFKYYKQVDKIYKSSFPKEERYLSLLSLIYNTWLDRAKLYCLVKNNEVYGFTYLIKLNDMIFVLYLAVDNTKRSSGYGSHILNWCLDTFKDKTIYLNIDEVDDKYNDNEIREKRLKFYLKNNFYLTDYLSNEEDANFNILSSKKDFDLEKYKLLDGAVAKLLHDSKSNIIKIH